MGTQTQSEIEARFWAKVQKTEGCWLWTASTMGGGYGQFRVPGRSAYAHRFSYELVHGPITNGMVIDHTCSNNRCVNPAHLEVVTQGENTRRTWARGRTFNQNTGKQECKNGHPLTGGNVIQVPGGRGCKQCRRDASLAYYHKQNPDAGRRGKYKK